jgi:DNA-binding LytR/AlgR family response regulator
MLHNCLIVDDDKFAQIDLENKLTYWPEVSLLGVTSSTAEAIDFFNNKNIDIIFLDLHLKGIRDEAFVKLLEANKTQVVWVTGNKDHAAEALDYNIADILVKPYTDDHFVKTMILVLKRFKSEVEPIAKLPNQIFVRTDKMLEKLTFADILYVEALSDYVIIHTKPKRITVHTTMKIMEEVLPKSDFFRCHNSYIIRLDKINSIKENHLVIETKALPISRHRVKSLLGHLQTI